MFADIVKCLTAASAPANPCGAAALTYAASCYDSAVASKSYASVLHWDGRKVRAYALTNDREYFAEATEAFFGTNDFYPFVRPELKAHDPKMYDLLEKVWGVKVRRK